MKLSTKISTIIFILLLVAISIVLFYYFVYLKYKKYNNNDKKTPYQNIPYNFIHETDTTIIKVFKDVSGKYGSLTALTESENNINYSAYYENTKKFAESILYNVGPHTRVAILSFNRPEWFYSHIGTMMAGGVSVGIYPTSSADNCEYIINHSCVDVIVIEDIKQLEKIRNAKIQTVKYIIIIDADKSDINTIDIIKKNNRKLGVVTYADFIKRDGLFTSITRSNITSSNASGSGIKSGRLNTKIEFGFPIPEDTATIIYTSGTTGDPKGVVITHKNIIESLKAIFNSITQRSNITINIQETYVSYLPLNHIAAQMMDIYIPLASVGHVTFADKDAMKGSLKDTLCKVRPTIFVGVPRVWEKIYEKVKESKTDPSKIINKMFANQVIIKKIGLDNAKYCISAAAPLPENVKNFIKDLGIELCDVYGMSETTGPISMGVPGCSKGVGVPIMNVKIDKNTSEILVKGPMVFKEYYKNKTASNDVMIDKWFKTGDTGYIDRDGTLYVNGRIKDLVITSGGENVSPIPIEESLLTSLNQDEKLFDYAVVVGDSKKFISILLIAASALAKDDHEKYKEHIIKCIDETNSKATNNSSTVKKYAIINKDDFDVDVCITPTLKIRRQVIKDKYKDIIDSLYEDDNV